MSRSMAGLAWCVLAWAGAAQAAEGPAGLIPGEAGVVIRLKSPQATIDKLEKLVDAIQPGMGTQVQAGSALLGNVISNPTLAGVDLNKDWWVAVLFAADSEPAIAFVIPAADADAMQEAVGEQVTFLKHESWGVYCDKNQEDLVALLKARIDGFRYRKVPIRCSGAA